ncbi:MAG: LuxR C-terminal-related transcriptional regulator [Solirubrobacteraceae bacterium]
MSSSPALRGRDSELALIGELLVRTRQGRGAVAMVEGHGGFGKTRFLAEAAAMATRAGIRAGSGAVDNNDQIVPMGALFAALFDGPQPLLDRGTLRELHSLPEQRYWMLEELAALLERAALDAPMLLCLDDMQWADGACRAAVRNLPPRLIALPIVWLFAFRPDRASPEVRNEFAALGGIGAQRLVMRPLDEAAVGQVIADMVDGEPDAALLKIAERAQGSPFLLVELLLGLLEEERIRTESGHAGLIAARLPARVTDSMRDRLARMSPLARRAAPVASVLGSRFPFEQLGAMLGLSPTTLLDPVDELLRADLLSESHGKLSFRHELIREAVSDTLPESARFALRRQAADVLLASGGPPLEIARLLLDSAQPGDQIAINALHQAAKELGPVDPVAASELSSKALSLTDNGSPHRFQLLTETAVLLHAAGREIQAKELADAALGEGLTSAQEAEVRLIVAGMYRLSPEVRVQAGRLALAVPGVSDLMRARHQGRLVLNLVVAGRVAQAREMARSAEAAIRSTGDHGASLDLAVGNLALEQLDGCYSRLLANKYPLSSLEPPSDERAAIHYAEVFRSRGFALTDRFDEALEVVAAGTAAARRYRQAWMVQRWELLRGQYLLEAGRLTDATSALEGVFADADSGAVATIPEAAGLVALGRLAIHTGNEALRRWSDRKARATLYSGTPDVRRHAAWLLALLQMARGEAAAARAELAALGEDAEPSILPMLVHNHPDQAQLMRIAVAVRDNALAHRAVVTAQQRTDANPEVSSIAATVAHCRGLLSGDRVQLGRAVELFAASARPLAHASALEDLAGLLANEGDRSGAIDCLEQSLALYARSGATWDAGRVRNRMRMLGIRRRVVSADPPATGWGDLTQSELKVVNLTAQGLTNRDVASRLFVSPHTVSMHLRHVYSKLGINSRAELARVALEHELARA